LNNILETSDEVNEGAASWAANTDKENLKGATMLRGKEPQSFIVRLSSATVKSDREQRSITYDEVVECAKFASGLTAKTAVKTMTMPDQLVLEIIQTAKTCHVKETFNIALNPFDDIAGSKFPSLLPTKSAPACYCLLPPTDKHQTFHCSSRSFRVRM
jgi:hypothetical protein